MILLGCLNRNQISINLESPITDFINYLGAELNETNLDKIKNTINILNQKRETIYNNSLNDSMEDSEEYLEGGEDCNDYCDEEDEEYQQNDENISINSIKSDINGILEDEKEYGLFPNFEGIGLYPLVSILNHSCSPNCKFIFNSTCSSTSNILSKFNYTISCIAIRDIDINEELCHSYINNDEDVSYRRKELEDNYGFMCTCNKCVAEAN